jgi:AraC-like DNA-binding protein
VNRVLAGEGAVCLLFAAQGRVEIGVGRSRLTLGPGEAFLAEPARRSLLAISHGPDADIYIVQFRRSPQPAGMTRRTLEVPDHVATRNPGRLTHLLRVFMEERHRVLPSRLVLHHLVVLMLCEMASSSRVSEARSAREVGPESLASRVDAFIAAHYHEPIRTPGIAVALRYNPDYLERAYRAERGLSIRDAIHGRRIREARAQLILQGASAIAEVAALCGFSDPANFRRVFKRATSMTPRGFRSSIGMGAAARHAPVP